MLRRIAVLWILSSLIWAQGGASVVVVISDSAGAAARESLKRAVASTLVTEEPALLSPKQWADPKNKVATDARAALLYVTPSEFPQAFKLADEREIPAFDLARSGPPKSPVLSAYRDPIEETSCAAYWMGQPFAHHDVAVMSASREPFTAMAKAFEKAWLEMPGKRLVPGQAPSADLKAAATAVSKLASMGATAVYVAGSPSEVRAVAMAARLLNPPLVVVAASTALGFESSDPKDPASAPIPEGTVVMLRDVPDVDVQKGHPERQALYAQADGQWLELEAYDAAVTAGAALLAAGGRGADAKKSLAAGTVLGQRGVSYGESGVGEKALAGRLRYVPYMVDGGKLRVFPPVDPKYVDPRPYRIPRATGWPPYTEWHTRLFPTVPGSVVVDFDWTDGKQRTIENELAELCLSTKGRLPVIDHVVREKIMAQTLSVASTKFLRHEDGSSKPGESFHISLVHHKDPKVKARMVWKCHVTGDDPEAGGRAFGSYCYVYSTFIWRTIFKIRAVDGILTFDDLRDLCLPLAKGDKYVAGTRRNVIRQLIVGFGGSMALTAAHEIGHCGGLGHDEKDPASIMNVKEGAGLAHELGFFIPEHVAILRKSLGTAPNATTKTPSGG